MKPYYQDSAVTIYCGDCRDVLPQIVGITAIVTDPPYGINATTKNLSLGRSAKATANDYPPVYGDDEPFDPSPFLFARQVVLWGANHYSTLLPASPSWLVWDKRNGLPSNDSADAELAWTNLGGPARLYSQRWMGMIRDGDDGYWHPTQKSVALMTWVVQMTSGVVCDPFMGSGTTLVAAKALGRKAIGIEIEERYCEVAAKRLAQETLGLAS